MARTEEQRKRHCERQREYRRLHPKPRKPREPKKPAPVDDECANCTRKLVVQDHLEGEMFCAACTWIALRTIRHAIHTAPLTGPIVALLLDGVLIGLAVIHAEASQPLFGKRTLPILSINEHVVAWALRRQGRLIQGEST